MKKTLSECILSVICLFFAGCVDLGEFYKNGAKKTVEGRLQVDLSSAQVLEEWDTHGGFHGDGEMFVKMSVPDGFEVDLGIVEKVEGTFADCWCAMPLTGTAYTYYYEWGGFFEHPETGEKVIPEIENGYWKMTSSGAQNWEIVILDTDANILYYYEYDS